MPFALCLFLILAFQWSQVAGPPRTALSPSICLTRKRSPLSRYPLVATTQHAAGSWTGYADESTIHDAGRSAIGEDDPGLDFIVGAVRPRRGPLAQSSRARIWQLLPVLQTGQDPQPSPHFSAHVDLFLLQRSSRTVKKSAHTPILSPDSLSLS